MISNTAEYALRAAVRLGQTPDTPLTTESLSASIHVPIPYLYKILRTLAKADLLKINRGRHGGFLLARSPAEIRLLEIVDAINPIARIEHCPLGLKNHHATLCPLHSKLDQAIESIQNQFRTTTLADLSSDPTQPVLCKADPATSQGFSV